MASDDKKRALDAAIAKLEKDFGKGTVMKLGDPAAQVAVETIPTGSLSLDLGVGAWRRSEGARGRGIWPGIQW